MDDAESTIRTHTQTLRLAPAELVHQLIQHLGATLVAVLADVRDSKLPYKWAKEDGPRPRPGGLQRLQVAHRAWDAVASAEGPDVARAWFIGANPRLDEQPPYLAIRHGQFKQVIHAAAAFVDDTDK